MLTPHQGKAINIEKSISLTANAGSGKTFVLTQRYLEIILNTSTQLNQVAAITFTEKAAGELYKQIATKLVNLLVQPLKDDIRVKVEKIRKHLVSAKISTIHSFCIDLLKEFPVEAKVDANFIPISEQKTSELMDLCIELTLRQLLNDPVGQEDVKKLVRLLGSKSNLKNELTGLLHKRKNILSLSKNFYSPPETEIAENYSRQFNEYLKNIFNSELPDIIPYLKRLNDKVLLNDSSNEAAISVKTILVELAKSNNEIENLIKLKSIQNKTCTEDGKIRKKSYLVSSLREGEEDVIRIVENFFDEIDKIDFVGDHHKIDQELAKYGKTIYLVFEKVLSSFEAKKYEQGFLDFEDILLKTKQLLNVKSVQKSLFTKYKYILVDEYQDTNEIQYEIFLPLVNYLKSGNLFIVGDEKQSIYRFRDAELKVFSETKSEIEKVSGEESLLTLPDSFRMAPAICFFVNSLFKVLFNKPRELFNEVPASDIICARSDGFNGVVELLIASGEDDNNAEAELIVKRIIGLRNEYKERLTDWNKFAVLVRKRSSFSSLEKAFIKYNVPFNVVGGTGFYQQQSISDVFNYFAFLLNKNDDGALIGVLRSPFFLVSDTDIFRLSLFEGKTYWEKLKSAFYSENLFWKEKYNFINENLKLADRANISSLLRKILNETNFISIIASRDGGIQELSNVNKLLSLTIEFFNEGFTTLYDYVSFLKNAISKTTDEAQATIDSSKNGVNLLTIHQSKGLEFTAVFLYKCDDYTKFNQVKAKALTVDKNFGFLTKVPVDENYFGNYRSAPVAGIFNFIESKKEQAELKRLLYVGLTRAIDFLFISQTSGSSSFKSNSFAGMIMEGLNFDFTKDEIRLDGDLNFLEKVNDVFTNDKKKINLTIPVTRDLQIDIELDKEDKIDFSDKIFSLKNIIDHSNGEVISATRFATFSNCPLKYNLFYNYKLGDVISYSREFSQAHSNIYKPEYNVNESTSLLFDDKSDSNELMRYKGKIIHLALQKNIPVQNVKEFIDKNVKGFSSGNIPTSFTEEIKKELQSFYNSEEFNFLNSFSSYKNEFKVYLKEENYYLFGILDKLLFDDKKLIIVDYKTDSFESKQIADSGKKYLSQIKFYSYIIKRLFKDTRAIEGRVVFTKQPENPFIFKYDEISDNETGSGIKKMIRSVRNSNYSVNLNHCNECLFADENSVCIHPSGKNK